MDGAGPLLEIDLTGGEALPLLGAVPATIVGWVHGRRGEVDTAGQRVGPAWRDGGLLGERGPVGGVVGDRAGGELSGPGAGGDLADRLHLHGCEARDAGLLCVVQGEGSAVDGGLSGGGSFPGPGLTIGLYGIGVSRGGSASHRGQSEPWRVVVGITFALDHGVNLNVVLTVTNGTGVECQLVGVRAAVVGNVR